MRDERGWRPAWTAMVAAAVFALLCAAATVVATRGRYLVGLDFEGGAELRFAVAFERTDELWRYAYLEERTQDVTRVVAHDPDLDVPVVTGYGGEIHVALHGPPEDDVIDRVVAELTRMPGMTLDGRQEIPPTYAHALGRPVARGLCVLALLAWGAAIALRRRASIVAAAAALGTAAVLLGWLLHAGATLSMACYVAALWWAPVAAFAAMRAARIAIYPTVVARLRAAWPAGVAFAVALGLAFAVSRLQPGAGALRQWVRAGARMAFGESEIALGLAVLAALIARPIRRTKSA
jgi:hypothetical protein